MKQTMAWLDDVRNVHEGYPWDGWYDLVIEDIASWKMAHLDR